MLDSPLLFMSERKHIGLPSQIPLAARLGWAALIVATLYVCSFSHLGAIGFVGPDEPRYAWVARDMLETGDWVTPRLYGKPWFEKPALYYWGAALSFKLFGVSEAAARLPSAVSALLATLALAWLAWRIYGAETARWLLLLLPTTVGMIGFSHAAATDMPFSGMLTVAMVAAAAVLGLTRSADDSSPVRTPWLALILFGVFLGAAVLAKGPAAIILCGGTVFFWALLSRRWRDAFCLFHPAALASFCATALPWYVLCARRNPDFLRVFLIEHNFQRYLTPEFQHSQPFWYYGPVLLAACLPWTPILLWTLATGAIRIWRKESLSSTTVYLLTWAGFCVIFFTLSKSKLPGYILPAIPAATFALTRSISTIAVARRKSLGTTLLLFYVLMMGIVELLDRGLLHVRWPKGTSGIMGILFLLLISLPSLCWGAGFACTSKSAVRNLAGAVSIATVLVPLLYFGSHVEELSVTDLSARTLASEIQQWRIPPTQLTLFRSNRAWRYSLNFYLHEELKDWELSSKTSSYVISPEINCREISAVGFQCKNIPLGLRTWPWVLVHVSRTAKEGAERKQ